MYNSSSHPCLPITRSLVADLRRHALALAADHLHHERVRREQRGLEPQRCGAGLTERGRPLVTSAAVAAALPAVAQAERLTRRLGEVDLDRVGRGAELDVNRLPVGPLVDGARAVLNGAATKTTLRQ